MTQDELKDIVDSTKSIVPDLIKANENNFQKDITAVAMSFEHGVYQKWYDSRVGYWGSSDGLRMNGRCTTSLGYEYFGIKPDNKSTIIIKKQEHIKLNGHNKCIQEILNKLR